MTGVTVNGGDNNTSTVIRRPGQGGVDTSGSRGPNTLAEEIVMDAEKSVMESFEFLNDGSGNNIMRVQALNTVPFLGSGDFIKIKKRSIIMIICYYRCGRR